MSDSLHLCCVAPGTTTEVVCVEGDDLLAHRLEAHGFWPGTSVSVVRQAPLGGPLQLRLRGFRLALRREEAQRVLVRPVEAVASAS